MTTAVQHRRGTTAEHSTFTGLEGEVTIDTTKDTAVIHDGALAGGYPLAKETLSNANPSTLGALDGASSAADDLFMVYDTSASQMKKMTRAELNNAITVEALDTVDINGGSIDGTTIGATSASTGAFTTLSSSSTTTLNGTTIPSSVTLVSTAATQTLTNKTLTSPTINGGSVLDLTSLTVDGNTTLGDASTDTVTVNGYMGVGGSPLSAVGVYLQSSALTGASQRGFYSSVTGNSSATTAVDAFLADPRTAAASFTTNRVSGFLAADATKGAGSTITNQHGVYIADQTQGTNNYGITSLVSSGTNKWNIYASGTAANYFAGNVGIGTSSPSGTVHARNVTDSATLTSVTPTVVFSHQSGSYVDGNYYGMLSWAKANSNGSTSGAYIAPTMGGTGYTTGLSFGIANGGGSIVERLRIEFNGGLITKPATSGHAVFNEDGVDADFRVESDTNTHALFVQGSDGNVGIGTSAPTEELHVVGDTRTTRLLLTDSGGNGRLALEIDANNDTRLTTGTTADARSLLFLTENTERMRIDSSGALIAKPAAGTGAVFNEDGVDADFRVESDTNTHALFVEGSSGNVGIGTSSPGSKVDVVGGSLRVYESGVTFPTTYGTTGAGRIVAGGTSGNAIVGIFDDSTVAADAGPIGILFSARSHAAGTINQLAEITAKRTNATEADRSGYLVFKTSPSGSGPIERLRIDSTGASIFKPAAGTGAVFNEDGVDADFRVESDTNTHALFVQGSDGNVGIGTSSPAYLTEIVGGADAAETALLQIRSNFINAGTATTLRFGNSTNTSAAAGTAEIAAIRTTGGGASDLVFRTSNSSSVVERLRIDSSGNVSIGGTADRATTVGSAALNIFNGTAPVGTLTNGISIYSSAGEAYVMDAAGNATLFSPHDAETNEWIFKSKHTPTGKVLRIDVEKLLRFVNDHFGLDAVQEFIEP